MADLTFTEVMKIVDDAEANTLTLYHYAKNQSHGAAMYIEQLYAIQQLKKALLAAANAPAQAGRK